MSSDTALRHHAFVYESDDEYAARCVEFLRDGLEAGEACIVAHARDGLAVMREALGPDAAGVAFVDVSTVYSRPAHALATYHRTFVEHLRAAPTVRAVAEMQVGPTLEDWDRWAGYEALTNVSYAHLPVWVVCTYGANRVPDAVIESVLQTHPEVLGEDWQASDHFEDPSAVLRRTTPAPKELPNLRSFSPGKDLETFREHLASEIAAQRVPEARALDMLVAATEIAANALQHGGGIKEARAGRASGRFVCEVVDRGAGFDDPTAGYVAPRDGIGNGLWVARQLAWSVETFHSRRGFTARLWL
jgi:anti-sigma regulatory factor (Ser/Thr protein kinase)